MRSSLVVALVLAVMVPAVMFPTAARADFVQDLQTVQQDYQQEISTASDMAFSTLARTRRAIALGPHLGGFGGTRLSPSDGHGGISFGLALYTFDLPTVLDLREVVQDKLKARLAERVKAIIASGAPVPTRDEMIQLVREVAAEVKAELFGNRAGRVLEKPSLGILVEGVRLMSPGGWQGRLGFSKGIGPVSLGFSGGFQHLDGDTMPMLGLELDLRLTPIGEARTPVFDLFTRFDLGFANDDRTTSMVVGLRALLDVI